MIADLESNVRPQGIYKCGSVARIQAAAIAGAGVSKRRRQSEYSVRQKKPQSDMRSSELAPHVHGLSLFPQMRSLYPRYHA